MQARLKPLSDQVMVITGASSGIGLVTAKLAARRGARVVLAARNEADLETAARAIRRGGGRAGYVAADVSDPKAVESIADYAVREFGRIDTWVNNAAVALYGRLADIPVEEMRRQFDVNYWGQVYGSRVALRHLAGGGALINVASALADRAIPLQGNYCAAKHALKAFTDSLRMEVEEAGLPISVVLIKPSSIDTPFFEKARSLIGVEPQPVPPVYAPEVAARAILHCAERPARDLIVGGLGKLLSVAGTVAPRMTDRYMERTTFKSQMTERPLAPGRPDNLYHPVEHDGGERGRNWDGPVFGRSLYTGSALHPGVAAGALGLLVAAAVAGRVARPRLRGRRKKARRARLWQRRG